MSAPDNKPYIPKVTSQIPSVESLKGEALENGIDNVIELMKNERIFAAASYLDHVEAAIKKGVSGSKKAAARMEDPEVAERLKLLRHREVICNGAIKDFNSNDGGWVFGHEMFGVSTYFKEGENDTVWLKMEGVVEDVDLTDCTAVVREIDLFKNWVPFCNKSLLLKEEGPAELIAYLNLNVPMVFQRDAILHAFTCDASYEQNCIMVIGKSVDEFGDLEFPDSPGGRLFFNGFRALVEPVTRNKIRICVVTNIDLRLKLPKSLLNFVVKKVAGVLIYLLVEETKKVKNAGNPYQTAMRADTSGFYKWMGPVLQEFFDTIESGKMPARFAVQEVTEANLLVATDASCKAQSFNNKKDNDTNASRALGDIMKKKKSIRDMNKGSLAYSGAFFWGLLAVLMYVGLAHVGIDSSNVLSQFGFLAAVWLSGFAFSQANFTHFVSVEKLLPGPLQV